jgi:hypothetical protein
MASITATVKGGGTDMWGGTLSLIRGVSPIARYLARLTDRKELRKDRRLEITLLGAAAGSTATETLKRIAADRNENGGKRTIETETLVNRATTSGDVTDINARYNTFSSRPTTYASDKAKRW